MRGVDDNISVEQGEEVDEQYVFLEQFPTDRRVENPTVPFLGELPTPLEAGRVIEIEGKVLPFATRFSVNLSCGTNQSNDVALHLNPRFDQNHVVRNSRLGGRWGQEECTSSQRNPFKRGTNFHMLILASEEDFMVAVNGIHFCCYTYRMPKIKVQAVQIHGDAVIFYLDYRMTDAYPEIREDFQVPKITISPKMPLSDNIMDKVIFPLLGNLSTGLLIGQEIEIVGRIKLLPHSFFINLQSSDLTWPHPDVFLHLNPRFLMGSGCCVVLNSWHKGRWGVEQRFPLLFRPGRPFSIKILCKREEYSITVDGVPLGSFSYRSSPHVVNTMFVQGDVVIKEITVS